MSGRAADSERPRPSARPCPICGRESQAGNRPFCSQRCADVDLNRWLSGAYIVPGSDAEESGTERSDEG